MLNLNKLTDLASKKRIPMDVDRLVGARIRARRKSLKMSQEKLATELCLTFQQVQKYENAVNRVSASKLLQIAEILQVPVSFFFDEVAFPKDQNDVFELATSPEGIELLQAFREIKTPSARKQIISICQTIANGGASH